MHENRPCSLRFEAVMETLHGYGISTTHYLQLHYGHAHGWFALASEAADLRTTFLLFFPICFHLHTAVGVKLLWVAVVGDWINLVLKWILFGERPYWWIQETLYYGNSTVPQIQQFPTTCETGPGSPSGHAMGAAGVYYAMVTSLMPVLLKGDGDPVKKWCVHGCLWMLFWAIQIAVCLSRIFIAAHFPHQVITGVVTGIAVAKVFNRASWIHSATLRSYFNTTFFLLSFALGLYTLLDATSIDPHWSLVKAQRWCLHPDWVHLDTTPFAGLLRNTGALFGLGLSLHLSMLMEPETCGYRDGAIYRLSCALVTLLLLSLLDSFRPPAHTQALFYILSFCKSATVPLTTVGFVPFCATAALNVYQRKKCLQSSKLHHSS
ncbi:glucose-6-phosphatase b [Salminus brasiliensis]|uniref:glucose-6-phosphatase b n=1 Tax=Salminus brasiliensis TaxID=930266 RepID=UPI003B82DAC0